jgi:hypothetical protein
MKLYAIPNWTIYTLLVIVSCVYDNVLATICQGVFIGLGLSSIILWLLNPKIKNIIGYLVEGQHAPEFVDIVLYVGNTALLIGYNHWIMAMISGAMLSFDLYYRNESKKLIKE